MFSRIIIKRYINGDYKLVKLPISFKVDKRRDKNYWITNDEKLCNNIIRAKNTIFDYCMNNKFNYFVTLTVNPKYNRNDLNWLRRTVSQIIRNLRVKFGGEFKYILIPEQHKDGSWHMHGLFDNCFESDFYLNSFGYLSWYSYDKIGFSSISVIKNYEATCKYITKYVKKDFEKRNKREHLYFCSHNLIKSNDILDIVCCNDDIDWDFEGDYSSVKLVLNNDFNEYLCKVKGCVYSILKDEECLL